MALNKEIPYKGFNFNVKVERASSGYDITINDLGISSFYKIFNCSEEEVINTVDTLIAMAKKWADEKIHAVRKIMYTDIEIRLLDEGFND